MKLLKRMLKQEKGAITMTVLAAMIFMTTILVISYFSIFNLGSNQNRKIQQISKQYSITDSDLEEKYNQVLKELDSISYIQINEIRNLGNIMLSKKTNTTTTDEDGNNFTIPAGFKLTDDADNVTEGIVIEDKDGNQFVWIPVGISKKSNPNETIALNRYSFDSNCVATLFYSNSFLEESKEEHIQSEYQNAIAKDINDFIQKVNTAGGYFIGRYEAGIENYTGEVKTQNSNNEINWTGYENGKLVIKKDVQVFNYVTQVKASELSKNMYESNENFECDLMNSYAWDTAILFLQEYGNQQGYPNNTSINYSLSNTGAIPDKCNIYDMASNCWEWDTETCTVQNSPITRRGGCYYAGTGSRVKDRYNNDISTASQIFSFRPILYIK